MLGAVGLLLKQDLRKIDRITSVSDVADPTPVRSSRETCPRGWLPNPRHMLPFSTRGCANGNARGEQAGKPVQRSGSP
jgi:hypothetical protein